MKVCTLDCSKKDLKNTESTNSTSNKADDKPKWERNCTDICYI